MSETGLRSSVCRAHHGRRPGYGGAPPAGSGINGSQFSGMIGSLTFRSAEEGVYRCNVVGIRSAAGAAKGLAQRR